MKSVGELSLTLVWKDRRCRGRCWWRRRDQAWSLFPEATFSWQGHPEDKRTTTALRLNDLRRFLVQLETKILDCVEEIALSLQCSGILNGVKLFCWRQTWLKRCHWRSLNQQQSLVSIWWAMLTDSKCFTSKPVIECYQQGCYASTSTKSKEECCSGSTWTRLNLNDWNYYSSTKKEAGCIPSQLNIETQNSAFQPTTSEMVGHVSWQMRSNEIVVRWKKVEKLVNSGQKIF